mmetsp:Transcript_28182/g.39788  ORF Transcript_28182/g.39788 Transcript_28182/m.39788 type:complete len:506 (+) Transcript_28182:310-1827(+)
MESQVDTVGLLEEEHHTLSNEDEDEAVELQPIVDEESTHKGVVKDSPKSEFPWRVLISVYLTTASDAMILTIVTPFSPQMCRDVFKIREENIGAAAGLISGSYSLATFISSFFLGHLSDLFGRKNLMLVGCAASSITTFLFSLSPALYVALLLRFFGGLLNANNTIAKAVVSDITQGKARVVAFGYLGASFSLARAISSAVSAVTTGIIIPLPILNSNDYVFPCFIAFLIGCFSFSCIVMFVPETVKKAPAKEEFESQHKQSKVKHIKDTLLAGMREIYNDQLLIKLILLFCITSYCNGGLLVAIPVFLSSSSEIHGMEFNPMQVGIAFSWFGFCAVVYQVFFFEKTVARINLLGAYSLGTILLATSIFLYPFCNIFYWIGGKTAFTTALTWTWIALCSVGNAVGFMVALPVVNTMLSSASNPQRQGLVLGTANSLGSFVRSLGPIISGAIFTLSTLWKFPYLLFMLLSVLYIACLLISKRLTEEERRVIVKMSSGDTERKGLLR